MNTTFQKITSGIKELFPDSTDLELKPDSALGDLPDWDSLAAVNLQAFLEQAFSLSVPGDLLHEELTLKELVDFIEKPAGMQMTG